LSLEEKVEKLAKKTGRSSKEIMSELKEMVNKKIVPDPQKALIKWKSDHKFELTAQPIKEHYCQVIGKTAPRRMDIRGQEFDVATIHLLTEIQGKLDRVELRLWQESTRFYNELELGKTYAITARFRREAPINRLVAIQSVKPIPSDKAPSILKLPQYTSVAKILDYQDLTDLFRGYVGKFIEIGGQRIGFELSALDDIETPPVTCWTGDRYGRASQEVLDLIKQLQIGDEVLVYGYVSIPDETQPRINLNGIFLVK